jgi:hypothetical protein
MSGLSQTSIRVHDFLTDFRLPDRREPVPTTTAALYRHIAKK